MFDETKVYESNYDVPCRNADTATTLFDNISFEEQHIAFVTCSINGGIKRKAGAGWQENLLCAFLGNGSELPEASISSSYAPTKLLSVRVGEQDTFTDISQKDEKLFLGFLWSGQSLYGTPYKSKVCLMSYNWNSIDSEYYYNVPTITLQAGTTISLKAYQLNFS